MRGSRCPYTLQADGRCYLADDGRLCESCALARLNAWHRAQAIAYALGLLVLMLFVALALAGCAPTEPSKPPADVVIDCRNAGGEKVPCPTR